MMLAGAVLYAGPGYRATAYGLWALGACWLLALLWAPSLRDRIERLDRWLSATLAAGMTWLLLAPLYLIVFSVGRLVLALRRTDPLNRRRDQACDSYWDVYRRPAIGDRCHRQY